MFKEIDLKTYETSPFALLGDQWTLITAGTEESCNTMTASWGGFGVLWGKPMATIYIRPQRFTKEFIDQQDYFSLSFFGKEHRKSLSYCGSHSGRDVNKIQDCGFTMRYDSAPFMEEAELVFLCQKLYSQPMAAEMVPPSMADKWYPHQDFHHIYYGEIIKALQKTK